MNCDYYRVIVIQSIRYSNRGLNKSASVKVKTRLIFIVVVQGRNERRGRKGDKGKRKGGREGRQKQPFYPRKRFSLANEARAWR